MYPEALAAKKISSELPKDSLRDKISGGLGVFAVLVGILIFAETAVVLYICYSPVPWGDMWDYWAWYVKYQGHIFWHLTAQHNEHRILTTRLFFLLDQFWFGGTCKLLAVAIPSIQLGHAAALWRLGLKVPGIRRSVSWFLGGLALATMFSSQQFTNFTWYFQVQFVIVYFGATLSCLALMKISEAPKAASYWLAVTILLALGTSYSMANGLLIWPALVSLSIFLGIAKRNRFILAALGVITWIAYFTGYVRPGDHPSPLTALEHLPAFFRFLVTTVGSPFGDMFAAIEKGATPGTVENSAAILGTLGLMAAVLVVARRSFWRNTARTRSAELIYIHLLLFALASMGLIASGRFTFPIQEAISSRYTTPALLFWLFLTSLAVISAERSRDRRFVLGGYGFQGAAIAMFLVFLMTDRWGQVGYARSYQQYLSEAEAAISNNVFDPTIWGHVNYYSTSALLSLSKYMSAHDLSVFDEPWHDWMGGNIRKHYAVEPADRCGGKVDLVRAIPTSEPGYRVEGWAWDEVLHSAPRHLILTDGKGDIIGSGIIAYPRPDVAASLRDPRSARSGWVGYVNGLDHSEIEAYVVLAHHGRVCAAGEHSAPPR